MSVFISAESVNMAGKNLLRAHYLHKRGDATQAAMMVKQSRALLYEEAKWDGAGRERVQQFLNLSIMLDTGQIRDVDVVECGVAHGQRGQLTVFE